MRPDSEILKEILAKVNQQGETLQSIDALLVGDKYHDKGLIYSVQQNQKAIEAIQTKQDRNEIKEAKKTGFIAGLSAIIGAGFIKLIELIS